MNSVIPFKSRTAEQVSATGTPSIQYDISSLSAVLDCAQGCVFLDGVESNVTVLENDAMNNSYDVQDVMGGYAFLVVGGRRYRIRSQVLQEPTFCTAVHEALAAESESNVARMEWFRARAVLQHTTNNMLSPGLGGTN